MHTSSDLSNGSHKRIYMPACGLFGSANTTQTHIQIPNPLVHSFVQVPAGGQLRIAFIAFGLLPPQRA